MSDNNKMSRRDWFRLRPRRTETGSTASGRQTEAVDNTQHSMGDVPRGLQPIEYPENHDGMNLAELPPMREALLSDDQVRQLFSDIESQGTDVLLMQRSARSQRATASKVAATEQLSIAQASILSGKMLRVQIRYHWQAANWIDTLERREDGVRLVRINHVSMPSKAIE